MCIRDSYRRISKIMIEIEIEIEIEIKNVEMDSEQWTDKYANTAHAQLF